MVGTFVVVHPGARDYYQVGAALAEAGRLRTLVTDIYGLGPRTCSLIDRSQVRTSFRATAAVLPLRIPFGRSNTRKQYDKQDALLGQIARIEAAKYNAQLLAYSGGPALASFDASSLDNILFQFHPIPPHEARILHADDLGKRLGLVKPSSIETNLNLPNSLEVARFELANAASILAASSFTKDGLSAIDPVFQPKTRIVPYGCPSIENAVSRPQQGPLEVLFVGQGQQRKGLHYLLEAWRRLSPSPTVARLTLVVSFADSAVMQHLSHPGIRVLDRLRRSHLLALMDQSNVLVLPSLVEGFGLVIPEGFSRGLHVVATHNTGLRDLPTTPGSSSLIPAMDVESLVHVFSDLISSRPQEEASYETARNWTWTDFRHGIRDALLIPRQ